MIVLISGGTRGIGLAVAEAYARQGDLVAISGGHDRQALDEAVGRLLKWQPECVGEMVDVKDARQVRDWVARVDRRWAASTSPSRTPASSAPRLSWS